MVTGKLQSTMPVVISHHPGNLKGSWPGTGPHTENSSLEEAVPFTRPAITTGAHLPWNVNKKSSYGNPRAICTVQSVPPITLLNSRAETTKLVYSKDSENVSQSTPSESPFKPRSFINLCEDEALDRGEMAKELAKSQPAAPSGLEESQPLENARLDSNQASSGFISPNMFNDASARQVPYPPQNAVSAKQSESVEPQSLEPVYTTQPDLQPAVSDWMGPVLNFQNTVQRPQIEFPLDLPVVKQELMGFDPSYVAESVGPCNTPSSSLYKSSGDSSMIPAADISEPTEVSGGVNGSSRSQGLGDKRKAKVLKPLSILSNDPQVYPDDLKENSVAEQRPVRRRLANRNSVPSRAVEKKNLEFSRMENLIEKLQNEQTELQARLKRQTKTCCELKHNLSATQQKLKAQEAQNLKLKSEMEFLRQNLSMLPQPQTSYDGSVGEVTGSPTQGLMGWGPEFPFPTSMPTHAEIAADLELDNQLLASGESGQDYLTQWNL